MAELKVNKPILFSYGQSLRHVPPVKHPGRYNAVMGISPEISQAPRDYIKLDYPGKVHSVCDPLNMSKKIINVEAVKTGLVIPPNIYI
jgi:hypothetical protein